MTLPKNKQLDQNEIDSMKVAVEEYGIRAIPVSYTHLTLPTTPYV